MSREIRVSGGAQDLEGGLLAGHFDSRERGQLRLVGVAELTPAIQPGVQRL